MNLKTCRWKWSWPILSYGPRICVEGFVDTTTKSLGIKAEIHAEYKAEALLFEPICPMTPCSLLWRHTWQGSSLHSHCRENAKPHIRPMWVPNLLKISQHTPWREVLYRTKFTDFHGTWKLYIPVPTTACHWIPPQSHRVCAQYIFSSTVLILWRAT
jgi:hypothetical protein